jgi:choline dehydrogenase-like flavoprotein
MHMGCEHLPECRTCQGYLCSSQCKKDASSVCLNPAVEQFGAVLAGRCRVVRFEASRTTVQRALCRWNDREVAVRAKAFVLAAGALVSPVLLLQSRSADHPRGLANSSDQVGRNLMRHAIDLMMITPKNPDSFPIVGQIKELALSDFYQTNEGKLGSLQSFGPLPTPHVFAHSLNFGRWAERIVRSMARPFWRKFIDRSLVLAAVMEDLPYAQHRTTPVDGDGGTADRQRLRIEYKLQPPDVERLSAFRRKTIEALGPYKPTILRGAHDNKGIAHVCGTCRFGTDPKTSVLDADNRAHDLDNLYVVDASFFPSSGGLNPSLTIAANALRVAEVLAGRI